jgi:hypothetical protein
LAVAFVRRIGLEVAFGPICDSGVTTFLPGIRIERGMLLVDRARLLEAGDLLHEAGHLAVMTPEDRERADGPLEASPADEMMAIAWSYAATIHLALPPAFVFHDAGYRGGSQALIDNFAHGRFVGVPMLDWIGLTVDPNRSGAKEGAVYPTMIKWLRDPSPITAQHELPRPVPVGRMPAGPTVHSSRAARR